MHRRDSLAILALSAAATGCARRAPVATPLVRPRRKFERVLVSTDRVIRTVVGLRPFRPSGFVVKPEAFGDKTVIHNYGHGGGGMTLSWGTSHLAVELALPLKESNVAVLGCGGV